MDAAFDAYAVLRVHPDADSAQIRAAYLSLVLEVCTHVAVALTSAPPRQDAGGQ